MRYVPMLFSFFLVPALGASLVFFGAARSSINIPLENAKKHVVRISNGSASCSGTIVSAQTLITAAHCVPPPPQQIPTPRGIITISVPPMAVVGSGAPLLPDQFFPYIDGATMHGAFGASDYPEVDKAAGDVFVAGRVVVCGYPLESNTLRCTEANHARGEDGRLLNRVFHALFNMVAIPGQSGGAVFSMQGKLIGIVSAGTEEGYTEVVSTAGLLSQEPEAKDK